MLTFIEWIEGLVTIYRGVSSYNKNGNYWTTDKEWARQFTQSGRDSEVLTATIDSRKIYRPNPLPQATNEDEVGQSIIEAKQSGYDAVWVDEGKNEPNSIFVINKRAIKK